MVSAEQGGKRDETPEKLEMGSAGGNKSGDHTPVFIPALEEGLMDESPRKKRFLDFLKAHPSRDWFLKFGLNGRFAPFSFLRRSSSPSDEYSSRPGPPPVAASGRRFRVSFVRKINWGALVRYGKEWIKNPANMAMLIWLAAVGAVLFVMFLVVSGALNGALPRKSQRKEWVEVTNQIANALFAIMCLYQHPKIAHHLVQVLRWTPKDAAELRQGYSKKGVVRPHERAHIAFVVALLNITCFAQYGLCGLYWAFGRDDRPDFFVNLCIGVGTVAPVIAGLYTLYGPLARKVAEPVADVEAQREAAAREERLPAEKALFPQRVLVTRPQWVGGLFDCWDDMTVAYLSFFCTFCVFGWNMERLGFGNMYVHIFTFVLLIVAPFWVFNVAGLSIHDDGVREVMGVVGILLCFFGLLYGGFWRIQMRKKFKLTSNRFCCGYPNVTDCMQWFFCWSCALAQEVRTGNFYDIEEDSFYSKQSSSSPSEEEEGSGRPALHPLPREGGAGPVIKPGLESPIVVIVDPTSPTKAIDGQTGLSEEALAPRKMENHVMDPPLPPLIQVEEKSNKTAET